MWPWRQQRQQLRAAPAAARAQVRSAPRAGSGACSGCRGGRRRAAAASGGAGRSRGGSGGRRHRRGGRRAVESRDERGGGRRWDDVCCRPRRSVVCGGCWKRARIPLLGRMHAQSQSQSQSQSRAHACVPAARAVARGAAAAGRRATALRSSRAPGEGDHAPSTRACRARCGGRSSPARCAAAPARPPPARGGVAHAALNSCSRASSWPR